VIATPRPRPRKNYAGTSPITRASGKKKTVAARFVHNDRLIDTLMTQVFASLRVLAGASAYYDRQRARGGVDHVRLAPAVRAVLALGDRVVRAVPDGPGPNHGSGPAGVTSVELDLRVLFWLRVCQFIV